MPSDILDIIIIISTGYGVLQLVLLAKAQSSQELKVPLIVLFLMMVWVQLEFLMVRNLWSFPLSQFFGTRYGSWFFLGPSLLAYLTKSLGYKVDLKSYTWQLIPGLILVGVLPLFVPDAISNRAVDYGMMTVLAYSRLGYTFWQGFYGGIFMLQFVHLFAYLIVSARMVYKHGSQLKATHSNLASLRRVKLPLTLMSIIIIGSTYFFYLLLTNYQYYRYWDFFYILPFSLMTYYIVYEINRHPHLIRSDLKLVANGEKYERSTIDMALLDNYAEKLQQSMDSKKLYLNPHLTLKVLADELGISPHQLSQVFSRSLNCTFFDYVNNLRVEEAKKLLVENRQKIIEVAMTAGFATKASFNKYFKLSTGLTPSQFLKKQVTESKI